MLGANGAAFVEFEDVEQDDLYGIKHPPQKLWTILRATLVLLTSELKRVLPATGSERDQSAVSGSVRDGQRPKDLRIS